MKATTDSVKVSNKRLIGSALVFAVCYVFLVACIVLMMALQDVSAWQDVIRENLSGMLSLILCTFLLFCVVYYYYYFEDKAFLGKAQNVLLIFSVFILSVVFCFLFGEYINIYARPSAMLALIFVYLFNRRQAVMLNFVFSVMMFVIDAYTGRFIAFDMDNSLYFSLMLTFVCGTFAVFLAGRVKTRGGLLLTGVFIAVPATAVLLLLKLPEIGKYGWIQYVASAGFGILGCVVSAVLALALLPVFERVFNRLTAFRLRELTSTNTPLLMRLKTEAPGTFNHSLVVAQLAETCALALGEDAELARAVAYYHDVGKLKQPDCFTENQTGYNIHNELTPELSADIIRSHANDGYDLLTAARLPKIFADVAREHHGTLPIKYFYAKANKLTGGDANVKDYSYFGPKPSTKIAAIVMIADASEAAVRSMKDRTPENVERVIRGIIEERMDLDQFSDSDITMRELTVIKQSLADALSGVHHHRVEYPAIRFNRAKVAVNEEDIENE